MAAAASSFVSSPLPPSLPLSSIATDSNRSIHLLTFAPHSPLFPSLTKPNRPDGPAALRVTARSGGRQLNRGPERPKSSMVPSFPSYDAEKPRSRDEIKQDLLNDIALLDRLKATRDHRERIVQLAYKLEAVTPTKEPLKSNSLNGKWKLLYTTQTRKFWLHSIKIYQVIDTGTRRAEIKGTLPFFKRATDLKPLDPKRVDVKFDPVTLAGWILIEALDYGQVEITYLDEKICVYKVNQRNLFILEKVDR